MKKTKNSSPSLEQRGDEGVSLPPRINLLEIGLQFGLIIALPLIVLISIGLYLDKTYHTVPLFILIGMFLALGVSTYALYKKINEILKNH